MSHVLVYFKGNPHPIEIPHTNLDNTRAREGHRIERIVNPDFEEKIAPIVNKPIVDTPAVEAEAIVPKANMKYSVLKEMAASKGISITEDMDRKAIVKLIKKNQ